MSIFKQAIAASQRMRVDVRSEGESEGGEHIDEFNGIVVDAPMDSEVDEGPKGGWDADDTVGNEALAQMAALNASLFGMEEGDESGDDDSEKEKSEGEDESGDEGSTDGDGKDGEDAGSEGGESGDESDKGDEGEAAEESGRLVTSEEGTDETGMGEVAPPVDENLGDEIQVVTPESLPEVDGEVISDVKDSGDVEFGMEEVLDENGEPISDEDDSAYVEMLEDIGAIESLGAQISQLSEAHVAIESFGCNPSALRVMQITGLLSGTALDAAACESFGYRDAKHSESQLALEGLTDSIKEKAAAWASKIIGVAKKFSGFLGEKLTKVWGAVSSASKKLASASWDKVQAGAAYAKAHPYQVILGVVAAIAAVAAVVVFMVNGTPVPGSAAAAKVGEFMSKVADKIKAIKLPFGSITASVKEGTGRLVAKVSGFGSSAGGAVKSQTLKALSWTKGSATALVSQLSSAYNKVASAVAGGAKTLSGFAASATKSAKAVGSAAKGKVVGAAKAVAGVYTSARDGAAHGLVYGTDAAKAAGGSVGVGAFYSAVFVGWAVMVNLVARIVIAGFMLIARTIGAVLRAVTGGSSAAAA